MAFTEIVSVFPVADIHVIGNQSLHHNEAVVVILSLQLHTTRIAMLCGSNHFYCGIDLEIHLLKSPLLAKNYTHDI